MIKLFYHKNKNFGDELSPYIISKLSGLKVEFCNVLSTKNIILNSVRIIRNILKGDKSKNKDLATFSFKPILFAVGSIIESSNANCVVWGSGMAQPNIKIKGGRFIITRGLLSSEIVKKNGFNVTSNIYGDPAILLPLIYKPKSTKIKGRIGIIPHYTDYDFCKKCLSDNNFFLINLGTNDVENVIEQIHSCEFIYSSSLHGLIVSHAYGIPAIWFKIKEYSGGDFKFKDYFSSVNIEPYTSLTIDKVNIKMKLPMEQTIVHSRKLYEIRKELIHTAPFRVLNKYFEFD